MKQNIKKIDVFTALKTMQDKSPCCEAEIAIGKSDIGRFAYCINCEMLYRIPREMRKLFKKVI